MGCDESKAISVIDTNYQTDKELFTENQIDTIRSTWPLLSSNMTGHGSRVFLLVFQEEPKIKTIFKHFKTVQENELEKHPMFQEHVNKFMQVVGTIVDSIESDAERTEVEQMLMMLGAKHATFEGFQETYFPVYSKCMLEVWESVIGEEFISEVKDSWKYVFSYMTRNMIEGFKIFLYEQDHASHDRECINGAGSMSQQETQKQHEIITEA